MSFGDALRALTAGNRVARSGWNGQGMWVALLPPSAGSDMTRPYLYIKTVDNALVPWVASQTDLLAEDWVTVP